MNVRRDWRRAPVVAAAAVLASFAGQGSAGSVPDIADGQPAEAQAAWAELTRLAPDFSIEHRRRTLPFRNQEHFELRVAGIRKAGIAV